MIRPLLLATAVFALVACGSPDPAPGAGSGSVRTAPFETGGLTAEGIGPLRIGMTRAEVEAALGAASGSGANDRPDPEACDIFHPARAPRGLSVMIEGGVLTSVWLGEGSTLRTDRGFGVGAEAVAIKAAYGPIAHVTPHKYADAPAEYIMTWGVGGMSGYVQNPDARGIAYHIGPDGRVEHVAAGGPSIQYVEGCA